MVIEREILPCESVPSAVGPYSQVVKYGNLLFLSGQISADVRSGSVIKQDVSGQTKAIMEKIKETLEECGSAMSLVLKCTVHLSDAKHYDAMNGVYEKYFEEGYPARLCVSGVQLYDGCDVEIDVIAGIREVSAR